MVYFRFSDVKMAKFKINLKNMMGLKLCFLFNRLSNKFLINFLNQILIFKFLINFFSNKNFYSTFKFVINSYRQLQPLPGRLSSRL